jgi:hypothetical protein
MTHQLAIFDIHYSAPLSLSRLLIIDDIKHDIIDDIIDDIKHDIKGYGGWGGVKVSVTAFFRAALIRMSSVV